MINISNFTTFLLGIILLLFVFPLALPNIEYTFLQIQFLFLIPIFIFLNLFITKILGTLLVFLYLLIIFLVPFDMPGSVVGWISMMILGFFFGEKFYKNSPDALRALQPFFLISIALGFWILYQNYQNNFSYELLSDYFEVSSINTVPILLVCSCNLFCALYFYTIYLNQETPLTNIRNIKRNLFLLFLVSSTSVIIFEFRSGIGIFALWSLVLWNSFGKRYPFIKYFIFIILFVIAYFLLFNLIYEFLVNFIVPGRSDLTSLAAEVSEGALRYDEIVNFWEVAAFSNKLNFANWSDEFSVSGMSDFVAVFFPLSIIFFLPCYVFLKWIFKTKRQNRVPIFIISFSAFQSFIISVLQPDFFSMFTFFAIVFFIFFADRNKIISNSLTLKN